MSQIALAAPRLSPRFERLLLPAATFTSAALVFSVEPMMGRLMTPLMGGGAGVWTASLVFFQFALLLGYLYAHLLRRVGGVRTQTVLHLGVLCAAAFTLPLRLTSSMGDPSVAHPLAWVLGTLTLSVGAPFAALSATAPLMQAWGSGEGRDGDARSGYGLYAASNLGSLLALLAYPLLIEPRMTLAAQRTVWTVGYGVFTALAAAVALTAHNAAPAPAASRARAAEPGVWRERGVWLLLAAAPSSLVLGVTTHLAADVGSAPLLWVVPLGLYLVTFILAFRETARPPGPAVLGAQAVAVTLALILLPLSAASWGVQLGAHLAAFFLTALTCHLALFARRPPAVRSTEFYLLISVGGVLGGAFNAFVSPVVFSQVWEYPLVLVLACLARPRRGGPVSRVEIATVGVGLAACALLLALHAFDQSSTVIITACAGVAAASVWLLRSRTVLMTGLLAAIAVATHAVGAQPGVQIARRSFYGVHRVVTTQGPHPLRKLMNGSILHGAQRLDGPRRCEPMTYYAPPTPIAQTFDALHARRPGGASVGVVGLGSGAVAALTRPGDRMRFFEIDAAVVKIARDDGLFTYTSACAAGRIDYTVGDGRLKLAQAPAGAFDLLLIDAFSSDSVPAHLLTTEALQTYLRALAPDGVLVLHLSNRNLELVGPAAAAVRDLGARALLQEFAVPQRLSPAVESSTVLAVARSAEALRTLEGDRRWRPASAAGASPWTDDHIDVPGAFLRKLAGRPVRSPPHA